MQGSTTHVPSERITLDTLRTARSKREPFAMLTAYDFPTAAAAQAAGVHCLLIGDSLGNVVLGLPTTREVPLELMLHLGAAVRRGAPRVFLAGDVPFESMQRGHAGALDAAKRFAQQCACDAVKIEAEPHHDGLVRALVREGHAVIAHLGLRPQSVTSADGYRAQARDAGGVRRLVDDARRMTDAGAALLLLEAVPNEAAAAVVAQVDVPVIGCGAGPACHGHVVVTHDMLGFGAARPPRFVPRLATLRETIEAAMREYVKSIQSGAYPAAEHAYSMKAENSLAPDAS